MCGIYRQQLERRDSVKLYLKGSFVFRGDLQLATGSTWSIAREPKGCPRVQWRELKQIWREEYLPSNRQQLRLDTDHLGLLSGSNAAIYSGLRAEQQRLTKV